MAALSAQSSAATVTVLSDVAEIHGEIAAGDAIKVGRALARGAVTVKIYSPGGDAAEALVIARAIRQQQAHLRVTGLCASACALLILPAAQSLSIDDGSVIALHAVAFGALLSAEREGLFDQQSDVVAGLVQRMRGVRDNINALLAEAGVDQGAIDFMYRLTSVSAMSMEMVPGPGNEPALKLNASRPALCNAWLLGPSALQGLGVRTPPWKPATKQTAARLLNEAPDLLYEGLPAPLVRTDMAVSCKDLQQMMTPP